MDSFYKMEEFIMKKRLYFEIKVKSKNSVGTGSIILENHEFVGNIGLDYLEGDFDNKSGVLYLKCKDGITNEVKEYKTSIDEFEIPEKYLLKNNREEILLEIRNKVNDMNLQKIFEEDIGNAKNHLPIE